MPFQKGNKLGNKWAKGQSGNPGGKPKSLRASLVNRYGETAEQLTQWVHELAKDPKGARRLEAIKLLLAYHSGEPVKPVEHSGELAHSVKVVVHDCHD